MEKYCKSGTQSCDFFCIRIFGIFTFHYLQDIFQLKKMIVFKVVEILTHSIAKIKNVINVSPRRTNCWVNLLRDIIEVVITIPGRILLVRNVNDCWFGLGIVKREEYCLISNVTIFFTIIEMIQNFINFTVGNPKISSDN